jgi:hypothetical protein
MRPRKPPQTGSITAFENFQARIDGKFTEGMASALRTAINTVVAKLNGYLTFGDGAQGSWTGNVDGYCKDFTFPATPDTEAEILHELGRPPRFVWVAMQDRAGSVYASNYSGWGNQKVFMKCSVANLQATLVFF